MFGWFMPRYPRHMYRHHRRYGLGRGLLWGLLIGPWLFRRALRWGAGPRRGWNGGPGGSGRYGGPGGYGRSNGPSYF
ncbi:MAG: hypothetical protein ACHQ1E_13875 [Ktedonobacterales bacterium]|jgi:hypothetical protein